MRAPVDEVVNLHQVEARDPQQLHGLAHLRDARLASANPDLGGDERLVARRLHLRQKITHHAFRRAVHRGRIDDRTSARKERVQYARERCARLFALADIEALPRPAADHGQGLPARRDFPRLHFVDHARLSQSASTKGHSRQGPRREPQKSGPRHSRRPLVPAEAGTGISLARVHEARPRRSRAGCALFE